MPVIRPASIDYPRRNVDVGQVWTVDGQPGTRWFVLTPSRVIALFAGGADHTPRSLVHTYGDRLRLEQTATVYANSVKPDPTNGASIVPGLVERIQWAVRQIGEALVDSRTDDGAASWLRTIRDTLTNASGDVPVDQVPPTEPGEQATCEHGQTRAHALRPNPWTSDVCSGPVPAAPEEGK